MEYKIKSIDKYNQERYDATKNAAIAALVTGTITTLLSFGNFGFSLDGIEEILRSIITAATSVGLAGSFLAMVKQFAKISKTEINIENIKSKIEYILFEQNPIVIINEKINPYEVKGQTVDNNIINCW